jgi:tRNA A37 threonylcarbamoyladenosine modification protein TsaB
LVYKTPIYIINALELQTPEGTGLSVLDARGDLVFIALYKNNKCLIKPKMINEQKAEALVKKYQNYGVYIQYKSVDIFNNLIFHLKNFRKVISINKLEPLYIKKPL